MENNMGPIIKQILDLKINDLFSDADRFNALLDDFAPHMTVERRVFHRALTNETLMMLKKLQDSSYDNEFLAVKIKQELEDEYGLSEKWSILLVSSFADAFGVKHNLSSKATDTQSRDNISGEKAATSYTDSSNEELLKRKEKIQKLLSDIDAELNVGSVKKAVSPTPVSTSGITITSLITFASDGRTDSKKFKSNRFFKNDTQYIGIKAFFNSGQSAATANLTWRIYKDDGTPFSDEINCPISINSQSTNVFQSWGWKSAGKWPVGDYKIVASINGGPVTETNFSVVSGSADILPSSVKQLTLFNSDYDIPPLNERIFTDVFYKSTAKYITFQFKLAREPGVRVDTTFDYRIINPDGSVLVDEAIPADIYHDSIWWCSGWGWNTPGNWRPGTYTYTVSLGKCKPITGSFVVKY